MKNLLPALLSVILCSAAFAADRSAPADLRVVPTVALPQAPVSLPGAASLAVPAALAAPALPPLPAAAAAPSAPAAAAPRVAAPNAPAASRAQGPQASAARPQLSSLDASLSEAQGGKSGPDLGAAGRALDAAFDGAKIKHACAACGHDDDHADHDDAVFPEDASGNRFIVPGHLEPLLPSHKDPKTWTGRITLHLHSIFSDGTMTPEAVMDLAYGKGVRVVALSDHDTTAGLLRAWKRAKELGMEFHPSVEMTARGGAHIGAVDLDITNPKLVALLERVRVMRYAKAAGMVKNLNALPELKAKGITLTIDEVKAKSMHDEGGTIEIPHIARVLVDKGLIQHVDDAYDKYLHGDVFKVPGVEEDPTVDEVLEAVRAAGGKAFLNHPYTVRGPDDAAKDAAVQDILDKGLDGVEVYRPYRAGSPDAMKAVDARAAKYLTMIDERGLLAGNGADFHGTDTHLDNLVVWMPKVLARQLTDSLKDANARAIDALERLDGRAAKKPGVPPSPVSGFAALAPLAAGGFQIDPSQPFPWVAFIPAAFLIGLAAVSQAAWFKELEKKRRLLSDLLLTALAFGFALSLYAILLSHLGL
jgi:predicted metal-dependent phosphoesterase TrpH